jgi:ankyrin repeat protein
MAAADLFAAAARGDAARIEALLAKGAAPDARDAEGRTPLMHAALRLAAEALLAAGARPDARDGDGRTALHHACARGHDGVAHRLLEAGLDLLDRDGQGRNALQLVLRAPHHNAATAVALLQRQAGVGRWPVPRGAALDAALGDPVLARELRMAGYDRPRTAADRERLARLLGAVKAGELAEVRRVLAEGPVVEALDESGATPVMAAVLSRHATGEVLRALLDAGLDSTSRGTHGVTPLERAHRLGRADLVAIFLGRAPREDEGPPAPGVASVTLVDDDTYGVVFYPNDPVHTLDFWQRRPRRLEGGGWASAAEALAHHPDFLGRAGAGWFVPYLERLAAGQRVPLAEVVAAYERLYGRPPRIDRFEPPAPSASSAPAPPA